LSQTFKIDAKTFYSGTYCPTHTHTHTHTHILLIQKVMCSMVRYTKDVWLLRWNLKCCSPHSSRLHIKRLNTAAVRSTPLHTGKPYLLYTTRMYIECGMSINQHCTDYHFI